MAPAEDSLIAPAPVAHRVDLASRPDDHVAPGAERSADALAGGWDHADLAEVVAETGRRHQDIVSGTVAGILAPMATGPPDSQEPTLKTSNQRDEGCHCCFEPARR
jgi:hypothetical protein